MFSHSGWSWSRYVTTQQLRVDPKLTAFLLRSGPKAFTGTVPFSDRNSQAAIMAIIRGQRPPRPTHPSLTDRLWELINQCWDQDRHKRPRILEVFLALNPLIHQRTHRSGATPVTASASAQVSDIQQQLGKLDPSNEEYRPLLYGLLSHPHLKPHIVSLKEDNLQGFIELLDEVG